MTSTELLFCCNEELGFGLCLDFMNSAKIYWACWKAIRITPSRDKLSKKKTNASVYNYQECLTGCTSQILLVNFKEEGR